VNRPADHRADFYALGVTMYELCTGRLPFATGDALELVHSHIARHPTPVHHLEPAIPEAVSDIVTRSRSTPTSSPPSRSTCCGRVAVRLLARDGHACDVAENGAEALRMLEAAPYDVVLVDVQMPVMDGHAAAHEIRRREQGTTCHVPIIAITASVWPAAPASTAGQKSLLMGEERGGSVGASGGRRARPAAQRAGGHRASVLR
jgi:CheY-like chemotaxis protein